MGNTIDNNFTDLLKTIGNDNLNYAHYIGSLKDEHVSVTLKYSPLLRYDKEHTALNNETNFIGLSENGDTITRYDIENFIYGVSPIISGELIIEQISKFAFKDLKGLDNFINNYHNEYMFYLDQKKYIKSLARYLTLSITYNYAVCFVFKNNIFENTAFIENIDYKYDYNVVNKEKIKVCYILGCPSQKMIDKLNHLKFKKHNSIMYEADEGISLNDVYSDINNINLYNTSVFYSGVLIRPLFIDVIKKHEVNKDITSYKIFFEKSTYATVYGMDSLRAVNDPILEQDKQIINNFFTYDDDVITKYLTNNVSLASINDYLSESYNVHQIGVSANIITKDNVLIFSIRGKNAIDSEKQGRLGLYPGSNGNAEILSDNVPFYQNSINEDLPTISLSDVRLDCNKELSREAYAELKLSLDPMQWDYYGICMSGALKPFTKDQIVYRRMHFNILAKQNIDEEFSKVYYTQKKATESYETSEICGLQLKSYSNWITKFLNQLISFLRLFLKSDTIIKACLSVATLIFAHQTLVVSEASIDTISSYLSIIVAVISIIIFVIDIIAILKLFIFKMKKVKTFSFTLNNKKKMKKIISYYRNNYKLHPATITILSLYVYDIFNKSKKNKN